MQSRQGIVNGSEVLLHNVLALRAVRLENRVLDLGDRRVTGQHAGDREETGLKHGIRAVFEADLLRDSTCIDDEESELLIDDLLLNGTRQMIPHIGRPIGAVEQEGGAASGEPQQVQAFEEMELVAADKIGRADEIGRADRPGSEAQMRDRLRARFVRIVDEIALRVECGIFGDDFDAVLVGADRAVGTQAVEDRTHHIIRLDRIVWIEV